MKLATYELLQDLLPQLVRDRTVPDPCEDGRLLWLLTKFETVLAADKLTWADLAAYLPPPALRPGDLVMMVNTITRWVATLTEHADEFLADLKQQGEQASDPIHLTERQSMWLWNLYRRALTRRTLAQQHQQQTEATGDNVIYLERRVVP